MMNEERPVVSAYWWLGQKNFGDLLTPLLIKHFCEVIPVQVDPLLADLTVAGSVLDLVPQRGWQGIVAGSGKLHESSTPDLTDATVLGLRGKLTARDSTVRPHTRVTLGDPGLMASELAPRERGKYQLGIVPHWTDNVLWENESKNARRYKYAEPHLIDVRQDPLKVVSEIGSCDKIVTSSLHGVVVADSFNIPRRVERFPKINSPHEGGEYKFHDYASAIGLPMEFGKLQQVPRDNIEPIQYQLYEMFAALKEILHGM